MADIHLVLQANTTNTHQLRPQTTNQTKPNYSVHQQQQQQQPQSKPHNSPKMTASTQSQSQSLSQTERTAGSTLHLLEARLHRLTYLLTGDAAWTGTPTPPAKPSSHDETISRRLQRLEGELERLSGRSAAVRDVLGLCMSPSLSLTLDLR